VKNVNEILLCLQTEKVTGKFHTSGHTRFLVYIFLIVRCLLIIKMLVKHNCDIIWVIVVSFNVLIQDKLQIDANNAWNAYLAKAGESCLETSIQGLPDLINTLRYISVCYYGWKQRCNYVYEHRTSCQLRIFSLCGMLRYNNQHGCKRIQWLMYATQQFNFSITVNKFV